MFAYESSYWTDANTLNPHSTEADDSDDIDAKLEAFMTEPVRWLKVCYKTLDNCYTFDLDQTYASAQALFSWGYIPSSNMDKRAFTDVFLPSSDEQ